MTLFKAFIAAGLSAALGFGPVFAPAAEAMSGPQRVVLLKPFKPFYIKPAAGLLIEGVGDSYIGNGGSATYSSATFGSTTGGGASYFGDLLPMANNRVLAGTGWNYGVGSQSSLGVVDRLNFQRFDAGSAAASSATIASGSPTTLTINTATTATFGVGETLLGTGVAGQNVVIVNQLSGTSAGAGTYTITNPNVVTITNSAISAGPNPAFAISGFGYDNKWSINSSGANSAISDPANIVFLNNATNDFGSGLSVAQSISDVSNELDVLGPRGATISGVFTTGANKLVLMGDAHPRGVAISKDEVHAIAASVSPSFASGFSAGTWSSTSGTCNGGLDAPVVAANYSAGAVSNGTNTVFTLAGSAASQPANPGTYNLTSAGVYWFNAADVSLGIKVALNYCYPSSYAQTGAALTAILDLHNWMISSQSDYVANCAGCSGTDYARAGALYNRPWVTSVDTWGAMLDPATGSTGTGTYLNLPGTSFEGLHNDSYGSYINAQVEAAALATLVPSSTPAFAYPTTNNFYVAKSGGALTFSGTLPGVMVAQLAANHPAGGFEVCYLLLCSVDNGSGTLVSNGVSEPSSSGTLTGVSGTINESTGAWSITFTSSAGYVPINGRIQAYLDPIETVGGAQIKTGNLIVNGQMDWANVSAISSGGTLSSLGAYSSSSSISGTSFTTGGTLSGAAFAVGQVLRGGSVSGQGVMITGGTSPNWTVSNPNSVSVSGIPIWSGADCSTANLGASNSNYVPQNWTLSGNSNDLSALTAGTMVMTCGYGTAPDGNPGFYVKLVGNSAATSSALSLAQSVVNAASFVNPNNPDLTRAYARITYTTGPGGHLYGIGGATVRVASVVGTSGTVNGTICPTVACTNLSGQAASYSTTVSLSKLDLRQYGNTAYSRDLVTTPASSDNDVPSNTFTSSTYTISFKPVAVAVPVDFTQWFQNAAERITPK